MPIPHSQYKESGTVTIDTDTCTNCGKCAHVCPTNTLYMEDKSLGITVDTQLGCIACGHCMMVCPEGSVKVEGRGISSGDLVEFPSVENSITPELLNAFLLKRRSIRHFSKKEIEPDVLKKIKKMAALAPMGIPPWDVGIVCINGQDAVNQIAQQILFGYTRFLKIFKPWLIALLRPFIGADRYKYFKDFIVPLAREYSEGYQKEEDRLFYNAPTVMIFHRSGYTEDADAVIACTYAMLAAESFGLGSTIIGGAAPILQRNQKLVESLGIPKGNKVSIVLILGYPSVRFERGIQRHFLND